MKEYDIKITETLEKTVTVEAASHEEAEEQVDRRITIRNIFWILKISQGLPLIRKRNERSCRIKRI